MACGAITRGSTVEDCDDLPLGGTRPRVLLANLDDIVSYTEDGDGQITAVTFSPGAGFYDFGMFRNDAKASTEVIKPDVGIPKFKHLVGLSIYDISQVQKNNIENLVKGRTVAVIENRGKDANSFELFGKDMGLAVVPGSIRNAHENGGVYVISLATADDEGELEPQIAQTLFVSPDYAATLAYVDSLVIAES